jgi:tRNA (mo5U34)-methyltransferase
MNKVLDSQERTLLTQQINQIKWYHSLDFGHGLITPGYDNSAKKLERLKLPSSLAGKTVLDIGAWDGFFSFEAERRGAKRVLATDFFAWNDPGKHGFDLAKSYFNSRVEEMTIDVLDLSPDRVGQWDIVLFLGVLYHMRHPLLALEKAASVTQDMIIIETVVDMLAHKRPAIAFYPSGELGNDATNWSGPNPAAVVAMLKVVGFRKVEIVSGLRSLLFRVSKAAWYKYKRGDPFWSHAQTDRIVIHAWK